MRRALALPPACWRWPRSRPAPIASRRGAEVNITDVEDEVMCPICGTLLELADSPQARREKAFVAKLIAAGKSQGGDQGRPRRPVRAERPRRCRRAPASTSPPTWCR